MTRLSINPDPGDRARRTEIRLRETDRSNRRALDALGDFTISARHTWGGAGNLSPNLDYVLTRAGHWTPSRDDGIASFVDDSVQNVAPGFYLNRPGRWALTLLVYSDATNAGMMRAALLHPTGGGDIFDGLGEFRDSRYRGSGFAQAGRLDQTLSWSGPVSAAEASNPITIRLRHDSGGAAMAPTGWRLQVSYFGGATATPTVITPEEHVPQDDTEAGSGSG